MSRRFPEYTCRDKGDRKAPRRVRVEESKESKKVTKIFEKHSSNGARSILNTSGEPKRKPRELQRVNFLT